MKILAVIGMGSIAKRHLRNLRQLHPMSQIYVVSSSGNNTQLPEFADALISLDELIDLKPDYVIVASPAPYHVDTAKKLLSHGIAVMIEKPLAHNVQSCKNLLNFCNENSKTDVAVGYCLRFLPSAIFVKNYLDQGLLGTVYNVHATAAQYLPSWRSDKNYKDSVSANKQLGGGVLLELSHELDYLQWLFGCLSLQHSSLRTTDELGLDVEEIADLVMLSEKNIYVSVHLDFIQKATKRICEIVAEHGRLVWDLMANSVTLYNTSGFKCLYEDGHYDKNNMYLDMLKAFEEVPLNRSCSLASVISATKVVELIDEAKQMSKWR